MQQLTGKEVLDVIVRLPKTLSPSVSVAHARAAFDDDHVHMLLITDVSGRLLGTLLREDLPDTAADSGPALACAVLRGRTLAPGASAEEARRLLLAQGQRRRAVVDTDGRLLGLLCLKRRLNGFCSDADVLARAEDARHT